MREATIWLQPGIITLEYGGGTISAYDLELAPSTGKLRTVVRAGLFESSYQRSRPQLGLFALGDAVWLKVLELEG